MGKYRKILVALDGSESSRNALRQAFRLAVEEKCWITVTSVIPPFTGDLDLTGVKGDVRASLAKPCEEALREAEQLAREERILIKTVCEEGETYERIVDLADAENCGVIVMGRRGLKRSTAPSWAVSPHASLAIRSATCWSFPRYDVGWNKILVATDGSKFSGIAVNKAIDFAKAYGGSLVVVSVVDVPTEFYAEAPQAVDDMIGRRRNIPPRSGNRPRQRASRQRPMSASPMPTRPS